MLLADYQASSMGVTTAGIYDMHDAQVHGNDVDTIAYCRLLLLGMSGCGQVGDYKAILQALSGSPGSVLLWDGRI